MSKLNNILGDIKYSTIDGMEKLTPYYTKEAKQAIKELFLELVGEDEVFVDIPVLDNTGKVKEIIKGDSFTPYMVMRNNLRNELRERIKEL
jgi:hypothetical protein